MGDIKYADDKPKDCRYCHWWGGKREGCTLGEEDCYYRLPEREPGESGNKCDGCPYKRSVPCIGFCISDIVKEITNWKNGNNKNISSIIDYRNDH